MPSAQLTQRPVAAPRTSTAAARALGLCGIAGVVVVAVSIGALHVLPIGAGVSPVRRTISEYALTDAAWVFNLGVIALAVGSLAVAAAVVTARLARPWSPGVLLLLAWSAALLVIVAFPKNNWAVGPSVGGSIHRAASLVAFLSLPVAAMLLTRRRGPAGAAGHRPSARAAFWLGAAALAWFSPLAWAWATRPFTGVPWWQAVPLGLVERGLAVTEVAAVLALAVWVLRASAPSVTPSPATRPRAAGSP